MVFFGLWLCICGCTNTQSETKERYRLDTWEDASTMDIFSSVEMIPLEFNGDQYPSSISDIRIDDNHIVIADNHNNIFVFSNDGIYYGCSSNVLGQGPEEYSVSMGYSWNPHSQMVEIITPTELLCYDDHFTKLLKKTKIPTKIGKDGLLFNKVYDISSSKHLLLPTGISVHPFRVFLYDSQTEDLRELFSYDNDIVIPQNMQNICFFENSTDKLIFAPPALSEYFYSINLQSMQYSKSIRIKLGNNFLSTSDEVSNNSDSQLFSTGKYILLKKLISSNRILILFTSGTGLKDMQIVIINRNDPSVDPQSIKLYDNKHMNVPIFYSIDDHYAYAVLDIETIRENPHLFVGLNIDGEYSVDNIEPESLVMLKYHFKPI